MRKVHELQSGHISFDSWSYRLLSVSLWAGHWVLRASCSSSVKWDGRTYLKRLFGKTEWEGSVLARCTEAE